MRLLRRYASPDRAVDLLDKQGRRIQLVYLEALVPPEGPPLTVFREAESGLLRVIHRELMVRFQPRASEKSRRKILTRHGLRVRRINTFIPDQMVVDQPQRRYRGEELVEISNELTQLEEVVMATPNFISQYRRQVPPSVLPQEWHLKEEDLNIVEAWKITTGRPEIVVAILDDGVDGADLDLPDLTRGRAIAQRWAPRSPWWQIHRMAADTVSSRPDVEVVRGFNLGNGVEKGGADRLHTNGFGGTSAATPLAAGIGALVLSVRPSLSREELKGLLEETADKIGGDYDANGHSNELGFGRVNAGKAVSEACE